jgi:hypothetical protein
MIDQAAVSYFLGVLGLGGILFTIYNHFKDPQTKLDKQQALAEKESNNKALILAQQLQWEKESNEKKFTELQVNIRDSTTMAQNHIHTIDVRVTNLAELMNIMNMSIMELKTIVTERFPKDRRGNSDSE